MSISDLYETTTPDPALFHVREVKVSSVGGTHGRNIDVEVNLEDACLEVTWKGPGEVDFEMGYEAKTVHADHIKGKLYRISAPHMLASNSAFVIEAREPKRNGLLLGQVEFSLSAPQSMKKRGRVLVLRQLLERTVTNFQFDPGWKKILPWYTPPSLEEARFDAAVEALLTEGKNLAAQLSGVDMAIALSETPVLKTWLILMDKDTFIQKVRTVEDRAHEADIRDAELITNKMVQILFGK